MIMKVKDVIEMIEKIDPNLKVGVMLLPEDKSTFGTGFLGLNFLGIGMTNFLYKIIKEKENEILKGKRE